MKLIIRTQLVAINDNGKESEIATDEKEIDTTRALTMLNLSTPTIGVDSTPTPAAGTAIPVPPNIA